MEDNSAAVTLANTETSYAKKCKHFLMVLNFIKEQISLGQIEAHKIYGKLNNADLHTKPLRSSAFRTMAHQILGQPPTSTLYPNTGRKSIAHRYGYIVVSTAQRKKASTRRTRRIYRRQASSNAPPAVPHSSSTGTDSGG